MRLIDADALIEKCGEWYVEEGPEDGFIGTIKQLIDTQPPIQPYTTTHDSIPAETGKNDGDKTSGDCISRQAVRYKLAALVNEFEEILAHIREREVNDSVCGLCEYDGAYIGQSGDWRNECPGFDRDDCFKLSDKIRKEWTDEIIKALPSAQPETAKRIVGKSRNGITMWYECDMCGKPVDQEDCYCSGCGRRLIDE